MTQEEFDKLYFKAKLAGIESLVELLLQLMTDEENIFAMQLFQLHNKDYDNRIGRAECREREENKERAT